MKTNRKQRDEVYQSEFRCVRSPRDLEKEEGRNKKKKKRSIMCGRHLGYTARSNSSESEKQSVCKERFTTSSFLPFVSR